MVSPTSPVSAPAPALALLRRLEWRVRHALENVLSGQYRSAFRGRGMEFDQVVKYEFGDDVRDIDWNVTARLGEPYRKKFVEEREVTVLVVFEDSPSLQFGSGAGSKREALLELAGLVCLLGAINHDRVGVLRFFPGGHAFSEPVRGRGPILHAAAGLLASEPPAPTGESSGSSAPGRFPSFLPRVAPRHSLLLWLGDFPPRPAPEGWALLRRRYQTMGFRVDDPWERALPKRGLFPVYDPLAGRVATLDVGSDATRRAHAAWRAERDAAFQELFPDSLTRLVVSTEENRLDALVRFFRARQHAA